MKVYLASPFFKDEERENVKRAAEILREKHFDVYVPMEHKIDDAWSYPNHEWGRLVFENDINAINASDVFVCLSYGRESSAGTNFECGYAYCLGVPVILVVMPGVDLMSLMVANGRHATVMGLDGLREYDFRNMPELIDTVTEQK